MRIRSNPLHDQYQWVGGLLWGCLLLAPVVLDGSFSAHALARNSWLAVYVTFISTAIFLSLFSVDFELSPDGVRRNIRWLGIPIRTRVVAHRAELQALQRTLTPVWEHRGIGSGTAIDKYIHEVELVTHEGRKLSLIHFTHVERDPEILQQTLSAATELLQLSLLEQVNP